MCECDTCNGACCRSVVITVGQLTADQLKWAMMRGHVSGAGQWRLAVPCCNLDDRGRCGIYAVRPDVCKGFEVGGELCNKARKWAGGK